MAKRVAYNGGTESYGPTSNPEVLKKGQIYEVIKEDQHNWYTNYSLKGIEGEFNSAWFSKPEYFAVSEEVPEVGKPMILDLVGSTNRLKTTAVENIVGVGEFVYKVITKNSVYFVQVQ